MDVFTCCIFTWEVIPIVLPAFLLGGAVAAFVPTGVILRYLGAGAQQPRAYAVAAMSGRVLSMCVGNIGPLFVSIYRWGAGIGPAVALLDAGRVGDGDVVRNLQWCYMFFFFFQAEDGIRDLVRSRGLGDVYKRQVMPGGSIGCTSSMTSARV